MRPIRNSTVLIFAAATALSLLMAWPCTAATWTVTSTADDGSEGTLRHALDNAGGGDTINVTANGTISLDPDLGSLEVMRNVTINGPGRDLLTVDGRDAIRVFVVARIANAAISGLTITHGSAQSVGGGGIMNWGTLTLNGCALSNNFGLRGGAVHNLSTLTLTDCSLSDNDAEVGGGAIANGDPQYPELLNASLTIIRCTLSGNQVVRLDLPVGGYYGGGAICNVARGCSASVAIENSTLSGNTAVDYSCGGAIASYSRDWSGTPGDATVTIVRSTLSDNAAMSDSHLATGGAISLDATTSYSGTPTSTLTIDSSTLSGNRAASDSGSGEGGAVSAASFGGAIQCFVKNSTLSGNQATSWAGAIETMACSLTVVDNSTLSGNVDGNGVSGLRIIMGPAVIKNTILANDPSGANLVYLGNPGTTITSYGHNLATDSGGGFLTAAGDLVNTDPMLEPLADNGGPTHTCALPEDSPAIDAAASTDSADNLVTTDQRGIARPQGDANDIGAFEAKTSVLTVSDVIVMVRNSKVVTVTVRIGNPSDTTAYNVMVTAASLNGRDTHMDLPLVFGAIKPGASKKCTLQFKHVDPGAAVPLTVEGTCSLGGFSATELVEVAEEP